MSESETGRLPVPRWLLWMVGVAAGVLLLLLLSLLLLPLLFEERLRATLEREMNLGMEDFTVRLPELEIEPFRLAATLRGLVIVQDAFSDPPLAVADSVRMRLRWGALLRGRLATAVAIDQPHVYLTPARIDALLEEDPADPALHETLEQLDFDIDRVAVRGGVLTYADPEAARPLELDGIEFHLGRIREDAPAAFRLAGRVLEGEALVEGTVDLMAEPTAVRARLWASDLRVAEMPGLAALGLIVTDGILDAAGELYTGGETDRVEIASLDLREFKADFIVTEEFDDAEEDDAVLADEEADEVEDVIEGPEPRRLQLRIDDVSAEGTIGMVNQGHDPEYRLFVEDAVLKMQNYSNHFLAGPGEARLEGLFMGSGEVLGTALFRPELDGPDFELRLSITNTHLPAMSEVFRAYGDLEATEGEFSFFAEFLVEEGHIDGYMQPFFRDMEVETPEEDDGLLDEIYGVVAGAITSLLEGEDDRVATEMEFSGPLDDPEMSTWEIIAGLLRNAFYETIIPGFEAEVGD